EIGRAAVARGEAGLGEDHRVPLLGEQVEPPDERADEAEAARERPQTLAVDADFGARIAVLEHPRQGFPGSVVVVKVADDVEAEQRLALAAPVDAEVFQAVARDLDEVDVEGEHAVEADAAGEVDDLGKALDDL